MGRELFLFAPVPFGIAPELFKIAPVPLRGCRVRGDVVLCGGQKVKKKENEKMAERLFLISFLL
jgi:hypothetical protein